MFELLIHDIQTIFASPRLLAANGVSVVAALCMIAACILSDRKRVFILQGVQCGLLCITQLILGMYGGLITLAIGSLRNFLTAFEKMTPRRTLLFALLIGGAGTAVNFATDGGWIGLLPVFATVLYTFGCHYLVRPNLQRLNILVNMLLWIGYSVSVLDYVTALTDATTALVDAVAFCVVWIKEKRKKYELSRY